MYLIAEVDWQTTIAFLSNVLKVVIGLSFVIFVHELGHFLVAKACGVKCEKFYVGFDIPLRLGPIRFPSRLVHFQWGETEYGVGILPLGGYVKMLGQDDDPRNAQQEAERIRVPKADEVQEFELDPRSFPAKPVPQRMAIISAGVIMNLIFAVIFATYAFSAGVPYMPTEIGGTVPGSPAWEAGLEPDSKIIQIGERGLRSESLRFDWDLSQRGVGLAQDNEDLPLLVRLPDGQEKWITIRPIMTQKPKARIPMIGVAPARQLTIGALFPNTAADAAQPPLKPGDRIVAVDGTSVDSATEFDRYLATRPAKPVTVTVERSTGEGDRRRTETVESRIDPNPLKRLGVILKHGPVTGIRPDSPAQQAGLQLGDLLVGINGEPIGDPLALPTKLQEYHGTEIEVQVLRDGAPIDLAITPRQPTTFDWNVATNFPMAAEALGIAFEISLEVAGVEPDSAAAKADLQAGDVLTGVAFRSDNPDESFKRLIDAGRMELSPLGFDWMFVFSQLQYLNESVVVQLDYQRAGRGQTAELLVETTQQWNPDRGIALQPKREIYTASSLSAAVSMGLRQTWEDATLVARLVKKLATGQMSFKNLGGPLAIVQVAGSEASKGLATFLLFLTFLSANLAILNFLPIPALDGGHMMFLAAEGIRGKPVDERLQIALTLAGVACLLGLMIFVFGLDIHRLF